MSSSLSISIGSTKSPEKTVNPGAVVPQALWTSAFWHSSLRAEWEPEELMIVVTAGEDVASVFGPNWQSMATRSGKYRPFDMNMPPVLKALDYSDLKTDPPLTVFGRLVAQNLACALRNQQFRLATIYCAPALRCVQTAAAFADSTRARVVVVEQLQEPEVVHEFGLPKSVHGTYLPSASLSECGFQVEHLDLPNAPPLSATNPMRQMHRIAFAVRRLAERPATGPVLLVGGPLLLKVSESIARVPDGFQDPLVGVPFFVPNLDVEELRDLDLGIDLTELPTHMPPGSMSVFFREQLHSDLVRLPDVLPRFTAVPGQTGRGTLEELESRATTPTDDLASAAC